MTPRIHEGFTCPIIENPSESKIEGYKTVETDPPVVIMKFQTHEEMVQAYKKYCRLCAIQRFCQSKLAQGRNKTTLTANDEQLLDERDIQSYF